MQQVANPIEKFGHRGFADILSGADVETLLKPEQQADMLCFACNHDQELQAIQEDARIDRVESQPPPFAATRLCRRRVSFQVSFQLSLADLLTPARTSLRTVYYFSDARVKLIDGNDDKQLIPGFQPDQRSVVMSAYAMFRGDEFLPLLRDGSFSAPIKFGSTLAGECDDRQRVDAEFLAQCALETYRPAPFYCGESSLTTAERIKRIVLSTPIRDAATLDTLADLALWTSKEQFLRGTLSLPLHGYVPEWHILSDCIHKQLPRYVSGVRLFALALSVPPVAAAAGNAKDSVVGGVRYGNILRVPSQILEESARDFWKELAPVRNFHTKLSEASFYIAYGGGGDGGQEREKLLARPDAHVSRLVEVFVCIDYLTLTNPVLPQLPWAMAAPRESIGAYLHTVPYFDGVMAYHKNKHESKDGNDTEFTMPAFDWTRDPNSTEAPILSLHRCVERARAERTKIKAKADSFCHELMRDLQQQQPQ